ncbi:toxin-antitoxin system YwqK family antitoxin [Polaromonas sp. UC242_47]|uniref:toxin-antitoxin system YwqK family antitoxin n=1 Tax=Polaromonas sp. UC242_47 TaxID=3374626 RepID=UPI0037B7864A
MAAPHTSSPSPAARADLPVGDAQAGFVEHEQFNETGGLVSRAGFMDGVLHGEMSSFGSDGKLLAMAPYEAGVLHGVLKLFDENGEPVQEAAYHRGVQQGVTRVYVGGALVVRAAFLGGCAAWRNNVLCGVG